MSTHSFSVMRQRSVRHILVGFLMALPLVLSLFSSAFASIPRIPNPVPQDIARAGVSTVRIVTSYIPAEKNSRAVFCTGLGVLIASWSSPGGNEQNTWILTDGSLINTSGEMSCGAKPLPAKLSSIYIYLSGYYNPQIAPITINNPNQNDIHCRDQKQCNNGPVLFSFNNNMLFPYIDVAATTTRSGMGIELTKSAQSLETPRPSAPNAQQQALQYLTPNHFAMNAQGVESGMPVVDNLGELVGMHLNGAATLTPQDIKTFLSSQPGLQTARENPVHDNWNYGIVAYYHNDFPSALAAFQKVEGANPQFQGAKDFVGFTNALIGNKGNGSPSTEPAHGIALFGFFLPFWILSVAGLLLLVCILLLVSILAGRTRSRRRKALKAELAEAERKATIEAQRIEELEAGQAASSSDPNAVTAKNARGLSDAVLHCPRCNEVLPLEANYCARCRLPLALSESGQHVAIAPQVPFPAGVVAASSIADRPTADILVDNHLNGQGDGDKTALYAAMRKNLQFEVVTRSNTGIKRQHKPNEDSLFAGQGVRRTNTTTQKFGLFVVADGMGGHANGQDASRLAIQTIVNTLLPKVTSSAELSNEQWEQMLTEGVQSANRAVHQHNIDQNGDMGTTITATLVVGAIAYISNVGDSRTYLYREGKGLAKITQDHSVVASLVEAGIIKPDDIYTHPKRNQIYRSLGEKPVVEVDSFTTPLQPGDKLLLCSDGLWDMVRDPKIEDVLGGQVSDLGKTGDALIQAALDGGGEDNVSIVVVHVTGFAKRLDAPCFQVLAKPDTVELPTLG